MAVDSGSVMVAQPLSSTTASGLSAHNRLSTSEGIKLLCAWNPRKEPSGHARWAERLNDAAAACGLTAVLAEPGPPRLQDIITLHPTLDSNQAVCTSLIPVFENKFVAIQTRLSCSFPNNKRTSRLQVRKNDLSRGVYLQAFRLMHDALSSLT